MAVSSAARDNLRESMEKLQDALEGIPALIEEARDALERVEGELDLDEGALPLDEDPDAPEDDWLGDGLSNVGPLVNDDDADTTDPD